MTGKLFAKLSLAFVKIATYFSCLGLIAIDLSIDFATLVTSIISVDFPASTYIGSVISFLFLTAESKVGLSMPIILNSFITASFDAFSLAFAAVGVALLAATFNAENSALPTGAAISPAETLLSGFNVLFSRNVLII